MSTRSSTLWRTSIETEDVALLPRNLKWWSIRSMCENPREHEELQDLFGKNELIARVLKMNIQLETSRRSRLLAKEFPNVLQFEWIQYCPTQWPLSKIPRSNLIRSWLEDEFPPDAPESLDYPVLLTSPPVQTEDPTMQMDEVSARAATMPFHDPVPTPSPAPVITSDLPQPPIQNDSARSIQARCKGPTTCIDRIEEGGCDFSRLLKCSRAHSAH
eukprot:6046520-Amphidinium_carterae.4